MLDVVFRKYDLAIELQVVEQVPNLLHVASRMAGWEPAIHYRPHAGATCYNKRRRSNAEVNPNV